MNDYVEAYVDTLDHWRWRKKAGNHEIVSVGESHPQESDALRAAKRENPGLEIRVLGENGEVVRIIEPEAQATED